MKGKNLSALVLVIEIVSISVLHAVKINAVKINNSEKTAAKGVSRNISGEVPDLRFKQAISLAILK